MERDYTNGQYEYDMVNAPEFESQLRDRMTRTMLINAIFYGGNDLALKKLFEIDLKKFKMGTLTSDSLNYFWAQPTEGLNVRKIHSGLPQLISEKMVDLLLSNGYEYNVEIGEEEDEVNQKRLEMILKDNNFETLLQQAIETESWGGGVAFKISFDKRFEFPLLEVIQPTEYESTVVAGRIVEDIFITYYEKENTTYKLKEIYGYDETSSYIKYKLFKLDNQTYKDANLSELVETQDLEDISIPGFKGKFSLYKANKLPNSEFKKSLLGESDYSGSIGIFDAIDETLSTMVQEFRDAKVKNFWPSNLLPVDPITKESYIPASLKKDFITYAGGIGEKEKADKPELIQGDVHSDKYVESFKKLIEIALNNAGLSPQSIGVSGLESTAASEESQELREKTSIRTREKKAKSWKQALEKLFELLLQMDDYVHSRTIGKYDIDFMFNDYKIETLADKTDIASKGITSKSWSIKTAVDYVHEEMTDEEKTLEVIRIKVENGINTFTKEEEAVYLKYVNEVQEQPQEPTPEQITVE